MTGLDYVDIPACATVVPPDVKNHSDAKVHASLPPPSQSADDPPSPSSAQGNTPTRSVFGNLPSLLLTSSLQIPTNVSNENPRNVSQLLSTRDPLSIPITTVNFRRFIGKIGPIFWLQDRIEEIVTWRKGWKVTVMWMIAYGFLCELGPSCCVAKPQADNCVGYYPRLILLLPNIFILTIIVLAHPSSTSLESGPSITEEIRPPPRATAREGSTEWLANIQGIQNLMGLMYVVSSRTLRVEQLNVV